MQIEKLSFVRLLMERVFVADQYKNLGRYNKKIERRLKWIDREFLKRKDNYEK